MSSDWICPTCGRSDATSVGPGALCRHDGRVLVDIEHAGLAGSDPVLGRVVGGQYAVYARLGRGGMGAVYRAVHRRLRRQVALKTILPDRIDEDADELRARFEQEALMLSELRHPGIVTVYDFGEEDGVLYMVLELIEGTSLADVLRATPTLPLERAVGIGRQLLDALGEPHGRGLIHRDIKPSNIMIEPRPDGSERVVLIDFGVAKARAGVMPEYGPTPRTQTGVAVGTPRYMAPEQLAGGTLGPWTDHYAVAVVLYRMLAGQSPFTGAPAEMIAAHLRDPVPPLPPAFAALDPVIARAMAKTPAQRFPDGPAFVAALEAGRAHGASGAIEPSDSPQRTVPMAVVVTDPSAPALDPALARLGSLAPAPEPTPSDFSSGWRGAVDATRHAEVASFGSTRRRRWLLGTAALVLLAMTIGALLATRDDPGDLSGDELAAASADRAEPVVIAHPDAAPPPPPPDAAVPDAAPDATPPDAAPPDAAPVRRAARTRRAPAPPTADRLARQVEQLIARCACGDAERAMKRLARLDRAAADRLDGRFTTACGLVGVGCLAGGGGGR